MTQTEGSDVSLFVQLLRFASVVSRPMRDGVAIPSGMGTNELRVLMCLGGEGPMAGHVLAELIGMPAMNVSRALAALTAAGWVEFAPDDSNRRRKPHRLTGAGEQAFQDLMPKVADVAGFLLVPLAAREKEALSRILDKLNDRVAAWPDG